MKDRILYAMASDLGIDRFENESEMGYCSRVLYSAMASWVKAAALDRPVTSIQGDVPGVSRRHIFDKCTTVLNEMLKRYPESRPWFEMEPETGNPIGVLQGRLIRHGDLLQVGFGTNLILAGSSQMPLSGNVECRKGEILLQDTYYSGIAMLQKIQESIIFKPEPVTDVTGWFEDFVHFAWWKTEGIDKDVQYFNAYKKSKNNHSCWQSERPKPVEGIWFARRNICQNGYEYYLLRQDEYLYEHRVDPFLQKVSEHRRFMMAMRHMAGNDVPIDVYHYTDHVLVKLRIHLPQKENSLLETFAWPHNSITDKLEWDMGELVWEFVKPHLCGLGIKLIEERTRHG